MLVITALQHVYLRTSRQLRLLDLETRSPLYSHFLDTLNGLAVIRAFGWETEAKGQAYEFLDVSQRPYYLLLCVQTWLTLVLDFIVGAEALIVVGLALGLRSYTSAGLLGLSLNNILCKLLRLLIFVPRTNSFQHSTELYHQLYKVGRCWRLPSEQLQDSEVLR